MYWLFKELIVDLIFSLFWLLSLYNHLRNRNFDYRSVYDQETHFWGHFNVNIDVLTTVAYTEANIYWFLCFSFSLKCIYLGFLISCWRYFTSNQAEALQAEINGWSRDCKAVEPWFYVPRVLSIIWVSSWLFYFESSRDFPSDKYSSEINGWSKDCNCTAVELWFYVARVLSISRVSWLFVEGCLTSNQTETFQPMDLQRDKQEE